MEFKGADALNLLNGIRLDRILILVSIAFLLGSGVSFFSLWYLRGIADEQDTKVGSSSSSLFKPGSELKSERVSEAPSSAPDMTDIVGKNILTSQQSQVILTRNLFNSEGLVGDAEAETDVAEEPSVPSDQITLSKLPLKILGIIFGGKPDVGLVLIENTGKKRTASYMVGDNVHKGAILKQIYESRIVLNNKGRLEYLPLEEKELVRTARGKSKKPASSESTVVAPLATGPVAEEFKEEGFERTGHEIKLTTSYRENLLGPQMSKVLSDAKAEPNVVGGEVQGFRLTKIREDSIYQKAGFQSGDVILEINGIPLKDAGGAIKLLQSLRNETEIETRVERNGEIFVKNIVVQ